MATFDLRLLLQPYLAVMAAYQPEEDAARWRRSVGASRVDQVPRDTRFLPHPSRGGSRGYDIDMRRMVLDTYQTTGHFPPGMRRSIQRWAHNTIPRRKTGNKSNSELSGHYLFLLVLFKWPQANYYECIAFIANETPNAKIFNQKAVSRALRRLGYTRKVTSTVAYQALTDQNLRRREMFFTRQWPYGIMGTPRRRLIDIDEFGLHLNAANRKYGSSPVGLKIRKPGHYDRGTFKLTIILSVETGDPAIAPGLPGSLTRPRVWARVSTEAGTTAVVYAAFVERVLNSCNATNPGVRRTIIHDNLSSHRAPEVYEAVRLSGHRVVCRPPYRPQDGPVEYAINQVCQRLVQRWSEVEDLTTMQRVVEEIIDNDINNMEGTFLHCGYIWN